MRISFDPDAAPHPRYKGMLASLSNLVFAQQVLPKLSGRLLISH